MNYAYQCKFCGKPGIVSCADDYTNMFQIEKWLNIIACDRCGKFMEAKRGHQECIINSCLALIRSRQSLDAEKRDGIESKVRDTIFRQLERFTRLVCNHFKVTTINEPEFTQIIFEKPDQAWANMQRYVRGVADIARAA